FSFVLDDSFTVMLNKLVTINLVVMNGEKYLRHCLDSILQQSYGHQNIEVNIWDNNSTDSTKEIIKEYEARFQESGFLSFKFQFRELLIPVDLRFFGHGG